MKKLLLILIGCGALSMNGWSQDPNYSQFYNNPIYYNPAMTAINNGLTFRANARNLWGPIPGRFNTFSGSFEAQSIFKMGIGGNVYTDVAGEAMLRTTGGYLTYSYRPVDTKNLIIQAGVGGGFVSKRIDWSKLTFSDQLDETLGDVNPTAFNRPDYYRVSYADFNTGLVGRFNGRTRKSSGAFKQYSMTVGVSLHHLSQPKDAFLGDDQLLPTRTVIHANANLLFNDLIYSPGFIFETQREFQTFTVGMNLVNRPFTFGIWFRNRNAALSVKSYDSFIFTVGLNLPSQTANSWRVMYGFDMTISRLKTSSYGTHELSLVIDFGDKILFGKYLRNRSTRRMYQCPSDFKGYQ
jgi:type IX secretion system PorP/SprF family membrane protein